MRALFLQAIDNYNFKIDRRIATLILRYITLALCVVVYTLIVLRVADAKAEQKYEAWCDRFVNDYLSQVEAEQRGMPIDPKEQLLNQQSEALARVLYGVKDNSAQDLKTLCWCVFNRVDNPAYPDSIEAVIEQPKQWMGYSEDNPVLDNLYKLAKEQIQAWQNGRRPVSNELIYMSWTPARIVLRDTWQYGMNTKTWVWSGEA